MGFAVTASSVIWHDLECGSYEADLPLWLDLASHAGGPLLDVGAGTGRVALALARAGHTVHALEVDAELAAALAERARGLPVTVIRGDACSFESAVRYGLCIVAMQTIHVLRDRGAFLRRVRRSLQSGGLLAIALLGRDVEPFDFALEPDELELDGVRYASVPLALRRDAGGTVVIERRRETRRRGRVDAASDIQRLAPLDGAGLAREAAALGLRLHEIRTVAPTAEHAGSEVVILRA